MTIKGPLLCAAAVLCLNLASAQPSQAATPVPALSVSGDGFANDGDGPWTMGWRFIAGAGVQVTALGVFDADGDGFAASHQVGLWDDLNALIATVTVTSADLLIDGFRYADIATINLVAGVTYTVGAADLGVGDGYYLEGTISTPSFITFQSAAFAEGSGLTFPGEDTPVNGYFGANLLVASRNTTVPEPATWGLMIAGFGVAGAALRRRRDALSGY